MYSVRVGSYMSKKNILTFLLVKDFLTTVGGEESLVLVKYCLGRKKNITDEYLAKKMSMKVTEIRTILNRLHYRGISQYNKTKNQKTGWYSYTWEINSKRIAELIMEEEQEKIDKLEQTQEFEKDYMFFQCSVSKKMYPFEVAAEYDFKSPETGNALKSVDNSKRMRELEKSITVLKHEMVQLEKMV